MSYMSELSIDQMNKQKKRQKSKRASCLYHSTIQQRIKSHTEPDEDYKNSFEFCNKTKNRLLKNGCKNCVLFKPLINTNGENE